MGNEMIEMDEAIRAGAVNTAWACYEVELRWARAALARGDKFRAAAACKAAWRKLGNALKAVRQ